MIEPAVTNLQATTPATQNEPIAFMNLIERVARDPQADVSKLERMFDMHQKMLERQDQEITRAAEIAFNSALAAVQGSIPVILKNCKNAHTHSQYANLTQINQSIIPIYTEHGFALSFRTEDSAKDGHLRIVAVLSHREGHREEYAYDLPYDGGGIKGNSNKTAIHANASTVSYGERYLTCMIFNIATADDDGNAAALIADTLEPAINAIQDAKTLDDLRRVFESAWLQFRDTSSRTALTVAKKARKKELQTEGGAQ